MTKRGFLQKLPTGDVVVDDCSCAAQHMAAQPETYLPDNVNNWRRRCRMSLTDVIMRLGEGAYVEVVVGQENGYALLQIRRLP